MINIILRIYYCRINKEKVDSEIVNVGGGGALFLRK